MLLKSFNLIHKKINAKLILVGYGNDEFSLRKYIQINKLNNKVLLVKKPKNVFHYYRIADLFVLTSIYEGFGNVLVEAGTFKIPIM